MLLTRTRNAFTESFPQKTLLNIYGEVVETLMPKALWSCNDRCASLLAL